MNEIQPEETFNYVVGYISEHPKGRVSCYSYGSEVQFTVLSHAKNFQSYVKEQCPAYDWKIFKLVELAE